MWVSLNITSTFHIPGILDCFYLVIQVGSMYLNDSFGLPRAFVTWSSKVTSPLNPFSWHGGAGNKKDIYHGLERSPTLTDLCHIRSARTVFLLLLYDQHIRLVRQKPLLYKTFLLFAFTSKKLITLLWSAPIRSGNRGNFYSQPIYLESSFKQLTNLRI